MTMPSAFSPMFVSNNLLKALSVKFLFVGWEFVLRYIGTLKGVIRARKDYV